MSSNVHPVGNTRCVQPCWEGPVGFPFWELLVGFKTLLKSSVVNPDCDDSSMMFKASTQQDADWFIGWVFDLS